MAIQIEEAASLRLDEFYRYTRDRCSEGQAQTNITGSFAAFEQIETRGVVSRPVPAEFGVERFFFRYQRHFMYSRRLSNGDIGIVTVLHERLHQTARPKDDDFL